MICDWKNWVIEQLRNRVIGKRGIGVHLHNHPITNYSISSSSGFPLRIKVILFFVGEFIWSAVGDWQIGFKITVRRRRACGPFQGRSLPGVRVGRTPFVEADKELPE